MNKPMRNAQTTKRLAFRADAPPLKSVLTHVCSFFSHVLWPAYVPVAVALMQPAGWRRRGLFAFVAAGSLMAATLLYGLVVFRVTAKPTAQHVENVSSHFFAAAGRW